jgi:hypothetical protein
MLQQGITIPADTNLKFWYYMNGLTIGTLELLLNDVSVWSRTNLQEPEWLLAEVPIKAGEYNVI